MGKGGGFRGRFDFDFLHFLAHFSSGSQFLSGRHIEQSIPDIRREKGEEDVAGSLLRSTQIIEQCVKALLSKVQDSSYHFIPFHCIAFQASIESIGRTMGANMPAYVFIIIHIFLYIFCLFTFFFFFFRIYAIYRGNSRRGRHSLIRSSNQETPTQDDTCSLAMAGFRLIYSVTFFFFFWFAHFFFFFIAFHS